MKTKIVRPLIPLAIFAIILLFNACQDQWEDRTQLQESTPVNNLMEEIRSNTEISDFAALLESTGLDSLLISTNFHTVWAPTNDALSSLSSEVKNDKAQLTALLKNHIVRLQYNYLNGESTDKVKSFADKYLKVNYVDKMVEEAKLIEPYDRVALNGVLHVIDKPLIPKMNVWEFIDDTDQCPKLSSYIQSLSGYIFDPRIATQIGIDAVTGKPVYDTITGLLWENLLINKTRDLTDETVQSTVVLFSDADYDAEFATFHDYFLFSDLVPNSAELTDSVTQWKICKDIVFEGAISPDDMPATITSTFGTEVNIGSFTIDAYYAASNGYVYIVSGYKVEREQKIPVIILEAEDTLKYVYHDPFGQTGFTRQVNGASGGYDFILDNHGANPGSVTYHVPGLAAIKYDFFIKAVDDFNYSIRNPNAADTVKQQLGWIVDYDGFINGTVAPGEFFKEIGGQIVVLDSTYTTAKEKYLIRNTVFSYQEKEYIQLKGNGKNRTVAFDYIKLVPVFE